MGFGYNEARREGEESRGYNVAYCRKEDLLDVPCVKKVKAR